MDFAKSILSKYGWKDGEGLGKDKQGIKKPIKANLKFDSAGLGASHEDGFGNNWWERCFNDAAQNVKVEKEKNGKVILDLKNAQDAVEVSTKGYSVKKLKNSGSGVYGDNFLTSGAAVSDFELKKYKVLTDEELFKACGGRTAHKGARHGLKLSGKLARIEQQEQELLAKMQQTKANKEIAKCDEDKAQNEKPTEDDNSADSTIALKEQSSQLPKKKKKRKSKHEISDTTSETVPNPDRTKETKREHNCSANEHEEPTKKKKKKKRKDLKDNEQ